ncbi:hypothetical protein FRC12_024184 [Ceratobasidium sp. 428]|nr:hypothetical protein FRC12_024184 [Ceratobasidium sp. 428]
MNVAYVKATGASSYLYILGPYVPPRRPPEGHGTQTALNVGGCAVSTRRNARPQASVAMFPAYMLSLGPSPSESSTTNPSPRFVDAALAGSFKRITQLIAQILSNSCVFNLRKAFRHCAVPGTPHNLSYESLVGVAARQAIVALSRSNPALYMALVSNAYSPAPAGSTEENQLTDKLLIDGTDDDDTNPTVEEVRHHVLGSKGAHHAAQPTSRDLDAPEDQGFEVSTSAPLPAQVAIATRSDRATERSRRLLGRGKLA